MGFSGALGGVSSGKSVRVTSFIVSLTESFSNKDFVGWRLESGTLVHYDDKGVN